MVDAWECGSRSGVVLLVDGPRGRATFIYVLHNKVATFELPAL